MKINKQFQLNMMFLQLVQKIPRMIDKIVCKILLHVLIEEGMKEPQLVKIHQNSKKVLVLAAKYLRCQ
jgi:hypothetical protein